MVEKKSEADWAIQILQEKKQPLFCWDLVEEILKRMKREVNTRNMASVYTQLNLDNRLYHVKDGYWDIKIR
ncbi:MAG: DNA-directed RNA polymerase subunit delta [Syntrophomonadaceae bacterium]|nr:DNA-directed RNA polymerase subunit delta [Syntrophomonadaceae bacterium]